ncbi:MAG: lamin tail domain-containing protein [Candidatus Cloacimonadota bacterium]|nr:lamin tail domain-containing protein [Candidatus Cloacimonadota bacterium]
MKIVFSVLIAILLSGSLVGQQIKINEVYYNHPGSDTGYEWIEIFNSGQISQNLSQWQIETGGSGFAIDFTFPDVIIGSGEFLIIGEEYVPQADIITELNFYNGGSHTEGIRLISASGDTIDTILYSSPNGNNLPGDANQPGIYFAPNVGDGHSLIRFPDGNDTNNCEQDFFDCAEPNPGSANNLVMDLEILSIQILPENPDSLDEIIVSFEAQNNSQITVQSEEWSYRIFWDENLLLEGNYPTALQPQQNITITENIGTLSAGYNLLSVEIIFPEDDEPQNNFASASILLGITPLIINEFLYRPESPNAEWVEIYNRSERDFNLFGWKIKDSGNNWNLICTNKLLPAGEYAIIAEDTISVKNYYNENLRLFQTDDWSNLNNSTPDAVVFADSNCTLLDSVYYIPANYSCPPNFSLERINPFQNLPNNWEVCTDTCGATPGEINSVTPASYDLGAISLKKDVFANNITLLGVCKNVGFEDIENALAIFFLDDFDDEYEENEIIFSTNLSLSSGDSLEISFTLENIEKDYYRFGFILHCANDLKEENDQIFTTFNSLQNYPICINEIMSAPSGDEPEWLEVFHDFSYPLEIVGWQIADFTNTVEIYMENFVILPDEYIILLSDLSDSNFIKDKYFSDESYPLHFAEGLPSLNNSEDKLILLDEYGSRLDSIRYYADWGEVENNSLERVNPIHNSNDPSNWESSVAEIGATPGRQNSIFVHQLGHDVKLSITPNPISLREKRSVLIEYNLPEIISEVNVRVFDVKGRLIKIIADQDWVGSKGSLLWDCKDEAGKVMPVGIYIIHLEAGGKNSEKVYHKVKTMVIGEK